MRGPTFKVVVALLMVVAFASGCQSMTGRSTGRVIDDSTITAEVKANEISFQALSAYPGVVKSSGLNVAWINTNTGASGILPLDGVTEGGYPALNKVVTTGPGTVVASIFGSVGYTNATCYVLPTVGSFFVPEEGPLPAEAAQPAPAPPA